LKPFLFQKSGFIKIETKNLTPEILFSNTQERAISLSDKRSKFLSFLQNRSVTFEGVFFIDSERFFELKIYTCIQSLMKMHPMFDNAIVQILLRDSNSIVILLRNDGMPSWLNKFMNRLMARLNDNGISKSRVLLISQMSSKDYRYAICNSDVTLDPFPFGMNSLSFTK
jgi:hypothetical protein